MTHVNGRCAPSCYIKTRFPIKTSRGLLKEKHIFFYTNVFNNHSLHRKFVTVVAVIALFFGNLHETSHSRLLNPNATLVKIT